ncbi:MAG: hypothetical protein MUD01_16210 [Chloroflexaceae bacterium]|jgi:hypothetical protein|nr:hypothetical protein [Chloroflexaceae bacterium]
MHIPDKKFVGMQISPISFIDEGVEQVLETLQGRVGVNVLLIGTISWLGLKVGRRISHELEGWPDHGVAAPYTMRGGSYLAEHPAYYANTPIRQFRSEDTELAGRDILEMVIPAARARGMQIIPEMMEPLFKYAGHGSASAVSIPNMPQYLEVDLFGRYAGEPCTSNPAYRRWWHSIVEDHCRNYDIDGIMWCNERNSPLDRMIQGQAPGCFCEHCRREAKERGIDVERVRIAFQEVYGYFQQARAGVAFVDGALIEFLRVLLRNPEVLIWERFWLERSKDLDRELYGIVKWCNPALSFGLNVWNRNHFNPFRKAQWPWAEQTRYCDWVKPITYQHQAGLIYVKEMTDFHKTILRDFTPEEFTPMMYKILGLNEAPWGEVVQQGMQPESYVGGQCRDTLRAVGDNVAVYMGIGVDAPRTRADQAVCTPEIVYESVMATYRNGGHGVVFSPNYAGMNLSNLDGAAAALRELGLFG